MENLIAWFDENKECLTIFENPKEKKAAIISNIITQLANECTCYTCRRNETFDTFSNENLIKLVNFISENEKILVCPQPHFEYKKSTYGVGTGLFNVDEFIEIVNSTEGLIFVYNIRKPITTQISIMENIITDTMRIYSKEPDIEEISDKFYIRFAQQNNKLKTNNELV